MTRATTVLSAIAWFSAESAPGMYCCITPRIESARPPGSIAPAAAQAPNPRQARAKDAKGHANLLCRNRWHQRFQKLVRHAEAALELLREIPPDIRRIKELVLVLDVHRAVVAHLRQHREKALPIHRAVARHPEAPPVRAIPRLDPRPPHHVPQNLRIL